MAPRSAVHGRVQSGGRPCDSNAADRTLPAVRRCARSCSFTTLRPLPLWTHILAVESTTRRAQNRRCSDVGTTPILLIALDVSTTSLLCLDHVVVDAFS